jgi:hypothetical protein
MLPVANGAWRRMNFDKGGFAMSSKFALASVVSLCLAFSCGTAAIAAPADTVNIFLVQNSGWMEPFYTDPQSSFKPLVNEIVHRVKRPGEAVVIASFNQSIGANRSPLMAYRGAADADIKEAIASIEVAKKPGSNALTDTDFKESLVGAIREFSPGKPSILWIFTNNKNSPQNSAETVAKNKEFYNWLQSEPAIDRIIAFPYKLAVKGRLYQANGVMIYGIAYGHDAGVRLSQMISANVPFGSSPVRLKPLNSEALTFVPGAAGTGKGYAVSQAPDRKTLVLKFDGSTHPATAELSGRFRNDFNPYDIVSAQVSLATAFRGGDRGVEANITPGAIENVPAAGLSAPFRVSINVPPLPSMWSPAVLFGSGSRIDGTMTFQLNNQKLAMSKEFVSQMGTLFPNDPMPDLFIPGDAAHSSTTTRPLMVLVEYPSWPLIVMAFGVAVVVFGGLFLASALLRPKKYVVVVDGSQRKMALKAFGRVDLRDDRGTVRGVLARGLGKPEFTATAGGDPLSVRIL